MVSLAKCDISDVKRASNAETDQLGFLLWLCYVMALWTESCYLYPWSQSSFSTKLGLKIFKSKGDDEDNISKFMEGAQLVHLELNKIFVNFLSVNFNSGDRAAFNRTGHEAPWTLIILVIWSFAVSYLVEWVNF